MSAGPGRWGRCGAERRTPLRVVPRPGGGLGEESAGARRAIWAQLPPDALLPVRLPRADRMGTQDPRVG